MKTCLSIAGSDSSGGAGIQADIKTFAANGVYGMTAITALTAQNTLGVQAIHSVPASFVATQINSVFADIPADALKLGMLANRDIIVAVAGALKTHDASNVVLDPVMVSTSGAALLEPDAVNALINELLPNVDIITPNVAELLVLCDALSVQTPDQKMPMSSATLHKLSQQLYQALPKKADGSRIALLSKGGHLAYTGSDAQQAVDLLITPITKPLNSPLLNNSNEHWLSSPRVTTENTHGTGCTLSAAICANLAKGHATLAACEEAKHYLHRSLASGLELGQGNGPLNHQV